MDKITRPMPRLDRSASIDNSSAVLRARLSGLVTVSTSPSRRKARHSASFPRLATLLTCSPKMRSEPAAVRSRSCAASPAAWSAVDVRAYPTFMVLRRPLVRFAFWTLWDDVSDKAMAILFGRDFLGSAAMWDCPLWACPIRTLNSETWFGLEVRAGQMLVRQ
jgi:hypothetical protein